MKAVVKSIGVTDGNRVIAISDIHGNLMVFKRLLSKLDFCENDILLLLGDFVEKGPDNLETLHYIMELTKKYQVYPILGNCDMVLLTVLKAEENERLKQYLLERRSTLHDMYERLGYTIDQDIDMVVLKKRICENYSAELNWLSQLPHIITAGRYYFVHAALKTEELKKNSIQDVISEEKFMQKDHHFEHTIVVGHTPVVLYDQKIPKFHPIIDLKKNIISIDGGCVLKADGQLNALIIENVNSNKVRFESMDLLPKAMIKNSFHPLPYQDSVNVTWSDGAVEVLSSEKEFSYCRHCSTGHKLWILNRLLFEHKGKLWADEGTDYRLPVNVGDEVSVVWETSRGAYVKKNGIAGWYQGELEYL